LTTVPPWRDGILRRYHLFDLKYSIISKPLDELPPGLVEEEIDKTMARLYRERRRPYLIPPGGAKGLFNNPDIFGFAN